MNITFCDLRHKEVINIADGKRLGRIIDLVIACDCGKICGIVVPGENCFSMFKRNEELFIPWQKITKIGDDVILVKLCVQKKEHHNHSPKDFASTCNLDDEKEEKKEYDEDESDE